MKTNLKEHFAKLRENLKPMTTAEKLDHLWSYYKYNVIVLVLVVSIVVMLLSGLINGGRRYLLYGGIINVSVSQEGRECISTEYFDQMGGQTYFKEVGLDSFFFENPGEATDFEMTSNAIMRLLAMVEGKMLDYVITDRVGLNVSLGNELFIDLRKVLSEEELAKWEGKIITMRYEETDEEFPVALNIEDTAFAKKYVNSQNGCYLAFIGNTQRLEGCRAFYNYLMQLEENS